MVCGFLTVKKIVIFLVLIFSIHFSLGIAKSCEFSFIECIRNETGSLIEKHGRWCNLIYDAEEDRTIKKPKFFNEERESHSALNGIILHMQNCKNQGRKIILVLGAVPSAEQRFDFKEFEVMGANGKMLEPGVFFLDNLSFSAEVQENDSKCFIRGNFNSLFPLKSMAVLFQDIFDLIVLKLI
jgi:hypothetical protein